MNEYIMPDFLPSRYSSWLELYLEASETMRKLGQQPDDFTEIAISQFESHENSGYSTNVEVFTSKWPFCVLKSRALDEMLYNMPDYTELSEFLDKIQICSIENKSHEAHKDFTDVVYKLQKLVPKNFKFD